MIESTLMHTRISDLPDLMEWVRLLNSIGMVTLLDKDESDDRYKLKVSSLNYNKEREAHFVDASQSRIWEVVNTATNLPLTVKVNSFEPSVNSYGVYFKFDKEHSDGRFN